MARSFQIAILLLVGLAVPARADFTGAVSAFCRFALLAPIKKLVARPVAAPLNTADRREQAEILLRALYPDAAISPYVDGGHSFSFRITPPDGRALFAKVARAVDDVEGLEIAAREVEFLRRVQNDLPAFAQSFPVVENQFPLMLGSALPAPVVVLEAANRGALQHNLSLFRPLSPAAQAAAWLRLTGPLAAVYATYGISHADIKPDNILVHVVDGQVQLKLADWGLHHAPRQPRAPSGGTPSYQSLATLSGHRSAEQDDVHGMKLVMLQMATGLNLDKLKEFFPEAFDAVQTRHGKVDYWARVPAEVRAKLAAPLVEVLENSYGNVQELHEAVERARAALLRVP